MDVKDLQNEEMRELLKLSLHGAFVSESDLSKNQVKMCEENEEFKRAKEYDCPEEECHFNSHKTTTDNFECTMTMVPLDQSKIHVEDGFVITTNDDQVIGELDGNTVMIAERVGDPTEYDYEDIVIVRSADEPYRGGCYVVPVDQAGNLENIVSDL